MILKPCTRGEKIPEFQWMNKKVILLPLRKKNEEGMNKNKKFNSLFMTISGKKLIKECEADILGLVVTNQKKEGELIEIPKEVQELFDKFPNIIKEPTELPPL